MPALMIDGEVQSSTKKVRISCRCEWCGEELTESTCCTITSIYDGPERTDGNRMVVLTRMCEGCFSIYSALGRDGIEEA